MAKQPVSAARIPLARARSRWWARQGLADPLPGDLAAVVAATGWPRTLGGIDVYLAVRARVPGLRRSDLEDAAARQAVQIGPAVRNCIHLLPRAHVPLALRYAEEQWRPRTGRELAKAGTDWKEVETVAAAAEAALAGGPLTPDALRKALPPGTARSLGEAGKKVGLSSPLPVALRLLEFQGRVERALPGGRLDSERYEWRRPSRNPFDGARLPADAAGRLAWLAGFFFRTAAPATVKDFCEWSGASQRDAKAALEPLGLQPVAVEGYADDAWAFEEDLRDGPEDGGVRLLPFEDTFVIPHGGPAPLADPALHHLPVPSWGSSRETTLGEARHMALRGVFAGGKLAGFWEYDPTAGRVVHALFDPSVPAKPVEEAAADLGRFIREELGHGRSFSLDTDDDLRRRAALIRAGKEI